MAGTWKMQVSADGETWVDWPEGGNGVSGAAARLRAMASDPRNIRDMGILLDAANAVELRDRMLTGPSELPPGMCYARPVLYVTRQCPVEGSEQR